MNTKTPKSAQGEDAAGGDGPALETALAEVEEIIRRIESGEAGLERSIAEYERGVGLIKHCRGVLERVEQRVTDLTAQMGSAKLPSGQVGKGPNVAQEGGL